MRHLINFPDYPNDPKKYKTHHELDCPDLEKIQEEILTWVNANTNFLNEKEDKTYWHMIDYKNTARACPSLLKYMSKIKIPLREISIGLLTESMQDQGFNLHLDNPPLNTKINFPIYNTKDVYTEWFDIPIEDLDKLGIHKNLHIKNFEAFNYNLSSLHDKVQDLYPCVTRYNMHHKPIVFNSWIPHRVIPGPTAKYPRIMLACMPIDECTHLLAK